MENRIRGLESTVGEHAVKIEGLNREVEHNKTQTDRLYQKFDEMVKVLVDIREQLATANGASVANKWVIAMLITTVGGILLLLLDKLL